LNKKRLNIIISKKIENKIYLQELEYILILVRKKGQKRGIEIVEIEAEEIEIEI
jgi:hypothetical protein